MPRKICCIILIPALIAVLLFPPRSARAGVAETGSAAAMWAGGLTALCIFGYFAWLNRPGQQQYMDWNPQGPGGFFIGAFTGASFVQSGAWDLRRKFGGDNIDHPVTPETREGTRMVARKRCVDSP